MPDVPSLLLQQPGALVRVDEDTPPAPPFSVFSTAENFDLAQRMARALASSDLVPAQYRDKLANCLIALDIAVQRKASPLTIMQNMTIISGRPAWSAQYIIASINSCGLFSPLRYEWRGAESSDEWGCRAYAYDARTNERLDGSWISIGMAKAEGWYQRSGSKWQTMPEQMLRYRAGSFFGRIYAGHITLGLPTIEEVVDSVIETVPRAPRDQAPASAAGEQPPRRRSGRRTAAPVESETPPPSSAPASPTSSSTSEPTPAAAPVPDSGLEPAPHRDTVVETDPF